MKKMQVFDIHVFCCINEREPAHPRSSCSARGSVDLHKYMKTRSKELKIKGIRVNKAGCLDRCELGPVMVIYPDGVWYHYKTKDDVDEIIERHILGGEIVERLVLKSDQKLLEATPEPRLRLRVEGVRKIANRIRKFEFVAEEGGELPPFTAGGHVDIFTGNGHRRSYSLTGDPEERNRYEIAILREPTGRGGSVWMHDSLSIGDIVEATAPKNNFPLDENATEHLLLAGGIGITPLLSMGRRLRSLGAATTLHYCTRNPETTAYAKDVQEVFGERVTFHHDGGDPKRGINLKQVFAIHRPGTMVYVCGPSGFIGAVQEAASHWPEGTVRFERFSGKPEDKTFLPDDKPFDIVLSRRNVTLTVPPGKTMLQIIRDAGHTAESSCEEGVCGSCCVALLGGKADHRDSFLSDAEKAAQTSVMICASRALKGETLILDI